MALQPDEFGSPSDEKCAFAMANLRIDNLAPDAQLSE
jgi:hypothetical protein